MEVSESTPLISDVTKASHSGVLETVPCLILIIVGQFAIWLITVLCGWTRSLRNVSLWSSTMFWSWLVSAVIYLSVFGVPPADNWFNVMASLVIFVFLAVYYIIVLVECRHSTEFRTLRLIRSPLAVAESIQDMCSAASVTVTMTATCWHWVIEHRIRSKKVSDVIKEPFPYKVRVVGSCTVDPFVATKGITIINIRNDITVGDTYSMQLMQKCMDDFRALHADRDAVVDCQLVCDVVNTSPCHDDILVCQPSSDSFNRVWINVRLFWLFSLLGLTWPYRRLLWTAMSNVEHKVLLSISVDIAEAKLQDAAAIAGVSPEGAGEAGAQVTDTLQICGGDACAAVIVREKQHGDAVIGISNCTTADRPQTSDGLWEALTDDDVPSFKLFPV